MGLSRIRSGGRERRKQKSLGGGGLMKAALSQPHLSTQPAPQTLTSSSPPTSFQLKQMCSLNPGAVRQR